MPLISILIPCRQEEKYIKQCLKSVLSFQIPNQSCLEFLVIDGMSSDNTRKIINSYINENDNIKLIDNQKHTVSYALNKGVKISNGEYIARVDVHSEYANDYIVKCLEIAKKTNAVNVGGPAYTKTTSYLQKAIAMAYQSPFAIGNSKFHNPKYEGYVDTVTYGFYKKDIFEQIGLFDEDLVRNQDDELNLRIIRSGGKIWQSPQIKSWYYPRSFLKKLFIQYMQYGFWKVRVIQKHKIPASWRHLVPGTFVVFLLFGYLISIFFPFFLYLWFSVILVYFLFINFGSLMISIRNDIKLLPVLPAVLFTYHFSYGFGFFIGILNFLILKRFFNISLNKFGGLSR